jgi:hypothetical protein
MRKFVAAVVGLGLGIAASVVVMAVSGRTSEGFPGAPEAVTDPSVPRQPLDVGMGEELLLVVGGVYPTRQEAVEANSSLSFGDLQGYYVVPVAQFRRFGEQLEDLGQPGDFALVSAFRTPAGAREFALLAETFGAPATILGPVESLGGAYAGLGQEAHPNGQGPLTEPLEPEEASAS